MPPAPDNRTYSPGPAPILEMLDQLNRQYADILTEQRRHNLKIEARLDDTIKLLLDRAERTDPSVKPSPAWTELETWPARLRAGFKTLVGVLWSKLEMPLTVLATAAIGYYTWRYTQQTSVPPPVQVQVQSMPGPNAAPSAPAP